MHAYDKLYLNLPIFDTIQLLFKRMNMLCLTKNLKSKKVLNKTFDNSLKKKNKTILQYFNLPLHNFFNKLNKTFDNSLRKRIKLFYIILTFHFTIFSNFPKKKKSVSMFLMVNIAIKNKFIIVIKKFIFYYV